MVATEGRPERLGGDTRANADDVYATVMELEEREWLITLVNSWAMTVAEREGIARAQADRGLIRKTIEMHFKGRRVRWRFSREAFDPEEWRMFVEVEGDVSDERDYAAFVEVHRVLREIQEEEGRRLPSNLSVVLSRWTEEEDDEESNERED